MTNLLSSGAGAGVRLLNFRSVLATAFSARLARFIVVGGTAAASYAVIAGLAATRWPDHRQAIGVAVCVLLAPFAFIVQRRWVFRSAGAPWPEFGRYLLLQVGCIVCASLLVPLLAGEAAALNVLVYAANAVASAGISFVVCTIFVFGRRLAGRRPA